MDNNLSSAFISRKLQEAKYDPNLGIRLTRLGSMDVSGKEITLIAVQLDPGKQLIPHLHEIDGEICIPLTGGILTLGKALKSERGVYKVDNEGKILVKWDKPQNLIIGKPIEIHQAEAHHLLAPADKPVTVFFYLPATHLGIDRKFVVYPKS